LAAALLLAGSPLSFAAASETGFSDWVKGDHSAARLIGGGRRPGASGSGADLRAGLEIRLDPGYLTYWRSPGDAGVAPSLDTSRSTNVADVTIDYPAPKKLDEAGSEAFGYEDDVVFPLQVRRRDPARPASLVVDFNYAVCATQCLPVRAELHLDLPEKASREAVALLDQAQAEVPRETALNAAGVLSIKQVSTKSSGGPAAIEVTARATSERPVLFVEAPEGWYVQAGSATPSGKAAVVFPLTVLQQPQGGDLRNIDLRLTLVDQSGAIEVLARAATPKP
jgi:DsbC/DsbD-like thiol-disulfide interchange protein